MSVIVKGMEMPKNCAECKMWCICECLNDFEDFESICYAVEDGDLIRDKNCPLIEIPTPHGRLGDLDELKTAFHRCDNSMDIKIASVRATINHAPTIIEAEGETDA